MTLHMVDPTRGPNDLVNMLYELGPGRYVCLSITGEAGRQWLAAHPFMITKTLTLQSLDGDEWIYIFNTKGVDLPPEETIDLATGVCLMGIEVVK